MVRWARLLLLLWLGCFASQARADDELAKHHFDKGVAAAAAEHWQEAAHQLQTSIEHSDRPAARYNLVLVYRELDEPYQVARHALAFLALEQADTHVEAEATVRKLLEEARSRLATLDLGKVPAQATLRIDASLPDVREGDHLLVPAGQRRLELELPDGTRELTELELVAGQVVAWPRPATSTPSAFYDPAPMLLAAPPAAASSESPRIRQLRRRLGWSLGGVGAALGVSAIGTYLGSRHRANSLEDLGPFGDGYFSAAGDYRQLRDATLALSFSASASLIASISVAVLPYQKRHWSWSVSSLLTASALFGAGLALMIREPAAIPGTPLDKPTLEAGGLLVSLALPVLTFGVISSYASASAHPRAQLASLHPLTVTW